MAAEQSPRERRLRNEFNNALELSRKPDPLYTINCAMLTDLDVAGIQTETLNMTQVLEVISGHVSFEMFKRRFPNKVPEKYLVNYHCDTVLFDGDANKPVILGSQGDVTLGLQIIYGLDYPFKPPLFIVLKPRSWGMNNIWHPNINFPYICFNDFGGFPIEMTLTEIIPMAGRMMMYQTYNVDGPLNALAADWARQNVRNFPVDPRDIFTSRVLVENLPQKHLEILRNTLEQIYDVGEDVDDGLVEIETDVANTKLKSQSPLTETSLSDSELVEIIDSDDEETLDL